ncbi:MAG: dihydroorotase, partial [Gemmatimonadota bacterium]
MTSILIRGGRIVDPSQGLEKKLDVLVSNGVVAELGDGLDAGGAEVIDAEGLVVAPGLIDLHVHLREPGGEHKETIASGAASASAGGFTSIVAMPNTDPPIDNPAAVGFVLAQGRRCGLARVYPSGAITVAQKGEQMAEVGEMIDAGAVTITDDGRPVEGAGVMRLALEYAQAFGIPVSVHAEELELSRGGVMNEGLIASRLGLTGIPNAAEDVMIARDLLLAELTGGRLHIQHVSTRRGVDMIRQARARGVRVSAEATPHHFTLTDAAVDRYRTDAKMNPPLRSAADRDAVREGVRDGTLNVIATDHAPHHYDEKERAFDDAPFGIVGLETALGLGITELVDTRLIDLSTLIDRMSCTPAHAFSLPGGTLETGSPADLTLFHPEREWVVDPARFLSLSRNTPFAGRKLRGRPVRTIVAGRTIWQVTEA